MSVRIKLTHHHYTVTVLKEQLTLLRGSLLAQALEGDPETKEIQLENPVVMPDQLEAIAQMARGESCEIKGSSVAVAEYLAWPLLEAMSSPNWVKVSVFAPYVNIYRPETYGPLVLWSIRTGFVALTRHILQVTPPGPLDGQALTLAVMMGDVQTARALIQRGVDPVTNFTLDFVLDIWYSLERFMYSYIWEGTNDSGYAHEFLRKPDNQTFRLAIIRGFKSQDRDMLKFLLQDARLREMAPLKEAFALFRGNSDLKTFLLETTNVASQFTPDEMLEVMGTWSFWGITKFVLAHPELPLPEAFREKLRESPVEAWQIRETFIVTKD